MKFLCIFVLTMFICFRVQALVSYEAGVNIEAQAQNSAQAKQEAMNKGYREAFLKVCSRLTSEQNIEELNKLTDQQLLHFIREVEVVAEKTTSNSYMADLNIKINENLLNQYLSENDMLNADISSQKVLIIPVYSDTDFKGKVLFEDGNVWRSSWLEKGTIKSGLFNFEVIKNDPENTAAININTPDLIDNAAYNKLRSYNSSNNIFIVNAIRAGAQTLVVTIKTYPNLYHKSFVVNGENSFNQGIEQTVLHISNFMQNKADNQNDNSGNIEVSANIKLKDWIKIEKKLNTISQIKSTSLKSAAVGKLKFTIGFSGSVNTLIEDMAQNGLYLQIINGTYTLNI
ncbi:MAG: hypothetical protein IJ019_05500 [Alphaproteobacteria bacterium]|nr:hypothetical protein [Alphaproteobacteria bacterium]